MKRPNPRTGMPFQRGDVRADGYIFYQYFHTKKNKSGFYSESWCHPDKFEKTKQSRLIAERKNPHAGKARGAQRRAAQLKRTWFKDHYKEEVKAVYKMAESMRDFTGLDWHVDHIIPLQGKLVSGLHVPWNLKVIPAEDNVRKGNKFYVETQSATPLPNPNNGEGEVYPELGSISTTGAREDSDDSHHHCGADARKDIDHSAQEGCRICVVARDNKMESLVASYCHFSFGEPFQSIEEFARELGCVCYKP